ncbi:MAG: SDR family oxidoreductase [Dehalococcoidia bacterium]|nr:SDR family oxidoreductase [Dehalococcoidia bacterium]
MFSLEGTVAVITGAAGGIGSATARRFAEAGARLVLADVADAGALAKELGGLFVRTDVSDEGQVKALMEAAAAAHGRIDIVINNAGAPAGGAPVEQSEAEIFTRGFGVNALGVAFGIKHAVPHMKAGGSIVNTASLAGLQGQYGSAPYVASKFAVVGITKTAALELAAQGIRVNCVCPGNVATAMGAPPEFAAVTDAMTPLGRPGRPEEVAALFHFLASDDCPYITGQAICVDGGMTAGPYLRLGDLIAGRPQGDEE